MATFMKGRLCGQIKRYFLVKPLTPGIVLLDSSSVHFVMVSIFRNVFTAGLFEKNVLKLALDLAWCVHGLVSVVVLVYTLRGIM
jgi:hypothetical protein